MEQELPELVLEPQLAAEWEQVLEQVSEPASGVELEPVLPEVAEQALLEVMSLKQRTLLGFAAHAERHPRFCFHPSLRQTENL